MFCRKAVIVKFTEKYQYQDLYFDNVGGSRLGRIYGGVQLVSLRHFYFMDSIPNVFSRMYKEFFRMPDLWREKANNNNNNKN